MKTLNTVQEVVAEIVSCAASEHGVCPWTKAEIQTHLDADVAVAGRLPTAEECEILVFGCLLSDDRDPEDCEDVVEPVAALFPKLNALCADL